MTTNPLNFTVYYNNKPYIVILQRVSGNLYVVALEKGLDEMIKNDIKKCIFNLNVILMEEPQIAGSVLIFRFKVFLFTQDDFWVNLDGLYNNGFKIVSESEFYDDWKIQVLSYLDKIAPKTLIPSYKREFKEVQNL